ncbi:MAG: TIGR02186 family protein [Magnetovibrio sp.]|nr:TIGR02186 family protein [Magnetovibrio sp.]
MRKALSSLFIVPLLVALHTAPAHSEGLDVDLSKPDVRLDVSFKGSELLLFGAKDRDADIIVVVRGPDKNTPIRHKKRVAGIWVSTDEVVFEDAPAFYALAATKPVDFILPKEILTQERIGTDYLNLKAKSAPDGVDAKTIQEYRDGLVRNMIAKGLYSGENAPIDLVGKQLFRTTLWFPANIQVGDYVVDTYLVKNSRIESHQSAQLQVHKVGIEAEIFSFAHEHALIYGLLAILIAVVSGWSANAVFRKRG